MKKRPSSIKMMEEESNNQAIDDLAESQVTVAAKKPRHSCSIKADTHYGEQEEKKGPGTSSTQAIEYHDKETNAPLFAQSKSGG